MTNNVVETGKDMSDNGRVAETEKSMCLTMVLLLNLGRTCPTTALSLRLRRGYV